jgi:hypothetical protein
VSGDVEELVEELYDLANVGTGSSLIARGAEALADAYAEIERLRAAGDKLAMHLDAHYGLGNPHPHDIQLALYAWEEARREQDEERTRPLWEQREARREQ